MKKKLVVLLLCLIFINSSIFAAQVRKRDVFVQNTKDNDKGKGLTNFTTYYLVDSNGRRISTQEYEYLDEVNSNLFIAKDNDKYGLINGMGQSLVPFDYEEIKFLKYNILKFKENGKYGLMDFGGKVILPPNYGYLEKIDDRLLKYASGSSEDGNNAGGGIAATEKKVSKIGLMDYKGNIITQEIYSYIDKIDNYLLRVLTTVSENAQNSPQPVPPPSETPAANPIINQVSSAYAGAKYGLIDYNGKVVLKPEYDYINKINSTLLKVKKGQSWGRVEFYHGNILNVMMDYQSYW